MSHPEILDLKIFTLQFVSPKLTVSTEGFLSGDSGLVLIQLVLIP